MIVSNLSEILGRKKLKISQVIRDTDISRPTLTALYRDTSAGIRYSTLDALCKYLQVEPGELFSFRKDAEP